jgi:hypothetical protein
MNNRKPTINQKLKIYENALVGIETENSVGLCNALLKAQDQLNYLNDRGNARFSIEKPELFRKNNMASNFPEIVKHKPEGKGYNSFWWGVTFEHTVVATEEGKAKRIEVLKEAIAELEEEKILNKKPNKLK